MNFENFEKYIMTQGFASTPEDKMLSVLAGEKQLDLLLCKNPGSCESGALLLPTDLLFTCPEKMLAICKSRLGLNTIVFARNCVVKKINKSLAEDFLNAYHVLNSTQSGFNYGLFHKQELIAIASFSKGRKMRRLSEDKRSYELIRFCCKNGISVAGGLSKLVTNFCREKKAGDVMTYVDKQFSDGAAFVRAGFKKHSETPPSFAKVDKITHLRRPCNAEEFTDNEKYYLVCNKGNIKLLYTP